MSDPLANGAVTPLLDQVREIIRIKHYSIRTSKLRCCHDLMKPLTLNQKRLVAGAWLVVFLFAVANEYMAWGVLGYSAKLFRMVVMWGGLLAFFKFGPKMLEEIAAHTAAKREADEADERARDKSNDAAETDLLRRSIGMPLNASREPTAQQSVAADRRENAAPAER